MLSWAKNIVFFVFALWAFAIQAQVIDFSASQTEGCAPLIVTFTDQTPNVSMWEWDFGNGNSTALSVDQPVSAVYTNPGIYEVTLTINGGNDSAKLQITVFENPIANFSASSESGCPPFAVDFLDESSSQSDLVSWTWDFGDGKTIQSQHPSHTYEHTGNYNVLLTVIDENGCFDTSLVNNFIDVTPAPNADFTANNTVACQPPLTVNFSNLSSGQGNLTYEWIFDDGTTSDIENPIHNFTEEREYDISLVVNDDTGCPDTLTIEDYVGLTSMLAGFEYSMQGCGVSTVSFTDTSGPSPTLWNWSFPGASPSSSTLANPSTVYFTAGAKEVTLEATNQAGCQDQITVEIEIPTPPIADFSISDTFTCEHKLEVSFTDNSIDAQSYIWIFGDGDTSNEQNPVHTYYGDGIYDVVLIVDNGGGCTDTKIVNAAVVIERPKANFTFDKDMGCIPLSVNFNDASTSNFAHPITALEWSFPDGLAANPSTDIQQTVEYNSIDSFDVQLIVTTQSNCKDTFLAEDIIMAGDKPNIDFVVDPFNTCADSVIEFTSLTPNANVFEWDFGDGGSSESENSTHIYADTGYFDITLIASQNGCEDTLVKDSAVYIKPPIALFNYTFDCDDPYVISFTDASIDAQSWSWDFGDGQFSNETNPVHTYDSSGLARVRLTVENGECSHDRLGVVILADPVAEFYLDSNYLCKPFDPGLKEASIDAVVWEWNIADSVFLNGANPSNTFDYPGHFDVQLIATAANACKDTIVKPAHLVVLGSEVDFTMDKRFGCAPLEVSFTDLTLAPDGIASYNWIFGDGQVSDVADPVHVFTQGIFHYVALEVTDNNGCVDIYQDFFNYIKPSKPSNQILFPQNESDICPGVEVNFIASVDVNEVVWNLGDGSEFTVDKDINYVFNDTGTFVIMLSGVDFDGCFGADTIILNSKKPDVQIIADSPLTADCPSPPLNVNFRPGGDADGLGTWLWNFGNGNLSVFKEVSASYARAGNFDVSLKYTDALGCTDSVRYENLIQISGPNGSLILPDTSDCAPLEVKFVATSTNTEAYTWDFGDGTVLVNYPDSVVWHTYMSRGIRTPKLILNNNSCNWEVPSNARVDVSVIPMNVDPDVKVICPGEQVDIEVSIIDTASDFAPIDSIWWSPTNTLTNNDALITTAFPDTSTLYLITVRDINGCIGPDSVLILIDSINPLISAKGGYCPDEFDTIIVDTSFSNHVGGNYNFNWTPQEGLNAYNVSMPFANPSSATLYTVTISDTVCNASRTIIIEPFNNPSLSLGSDFVDICYGLQDTLSVLGAASYLWSPSFGINDPTSSTPIINSIDLVASKRDSLLISYQVIGIDGNKCRDTAYVTAKIRALPLIPTPKDTAVCAGDSVSISIDDSANNYIWFPAQRLSDSTGSTVLATPQTAEFYNIIGVDQWGCIDTAGQVFVDVHELPVLDYNGGGPLLKGQTIELLDFNGPGNYNYRWQTSTNVELPDNYLVAVTPDQTTFYEIFVSTKTLPVCTVSDTMTVIVYDKVELATPTAFTPNNDGENEIVYAYVKGIDLNTFSFKIFNRWGEIVFETNDPNIGWDGTNDGKQLEMDTYMIYISGISLIGQPIEYKTDITIIR